MCLTSRLLYLHECQFEQKKIKYISLIPHKHEYGFRQTNKNNIHKTIIETKTTFG